MRLFIALTSLAVLAAAPAAGAATLHELPFIAVAERDVATCLDATGAPGGVTLLGSYSRRRAATDLLTVGADRATRVGMGAQFICPSVAEAPSGAAVVAGNVLRRDGAVVRHLDVRVRVRDAGGDFGPPVRLGADAFSPAAAVSPSGHAVVAWLQARPVPRSSRERYRLVAARRAPGGAFGAPQRVAGWRSSPDVGFKAAVDAAGTVTVLWSRGGFDDDWSSRLSVATATQGAPFAVQRLQRLSSATMGFGPPVLAVAPDGWVLLAYAQDFDELPAVFERAPGAARFTRVTLPAPGAGDDAFYSSPTVAIRDGGGAVVAWQEQRERGPGVTGVTRAAAGAFTAPSAVAPPRSRGGDAFDLFDSYDPFDPFGGPPFEFEEEPLRAALTADGRALLAWIAGTGRRPLRVNAAHAAIGRLGGGFGPAQVLGAPLRTTGAVAPLVLADGRAAVAWTDNAGMPRDGRLHVAVEGGAEPPAPAAPRLEVTHPGPQRLYAGQPLRVRVACDRACDLRARIPQRGSDDVTASTRLAGGTRRLDVGTVGGLRDGRSRTVTAVIRASAPGGRETVQRTLRVRVTRRPAPSLRQPLDLRARRRGDAIVVTWRTAAPARRQWFFVHARARRSESNEEADQGAIAQEPGAGRTRFSVRLRPERPGRHRWVAVSAEGLDGSADGTPAIVRVR